MITILLEGKEYQLDVEQAKKLDLLKEKDNKVRSWEEFVKKYSGSHGYSYNLTGKMITHSDTPIYTTDQLTKREATAIAAFSQLLKLRRDWIGEWEPDWLEAKNKFTIVTNSHGVTIFDTYFSIRALSFPTRQMAIDFIKTFRELIKEAQILI